MFGVWLQSAAMVAAIPLARFFVLIIIVSVLRLAILLAGALS